MKKTFLLILSIIIFNSCDDGKIEVASFDFSSSTLKGCNENVQNNFFAYIIKDERALIIKIPESNFENQLTVIVPPITIDGTNQVIYRDYVGNITNDNICGFPTSVAVGIEKEWKGVGGFIKIETVLARTDPDATTGATSYNNYNHTVTLVNPSFDNGVGGQQKADFIFLGAYSKPNVNSMIDFKGGTISPCPTNNNYYKLSNRQSVVLSVDNSIFDTSIVDIPKTKIIDGTNNNFIFRVHNTEQIAASFCGTLPPVTTSLAETWKARSGGTIQVVTTAIPGTPITYQHTVRLLNVILEKGPLSFSLGNIYPLGSFIN